MKEGLLPSRMFSNNCNELCSLSAHGQDIVYLHGEIQSAVQVDKQILAHLLLVLVSAID